MTKKVTFEAGRFSEKDSRLRSGQLAEIVGCTRKRICELAVDGQIPGAKRTKGGRIKDGHWYFVKCPARDEWIEERRMRKNIRDAQKGRKWPRKVPPQHQGLYKFSRAVRFLKDFPLTQWHPALIEELKRQLLPVALALWPDGPPRLKKENS